jgi:prepilin-type N-terminal cleavage/methylation domain-containing protein
MRSNKRLLAVEEQNPSGMGVAMSNAHKVSNQIRQNLSLRKPALRKLVAGFSLVELMVAMSVFVIVGGAAIALVRRHMPLFNTAQNQTNLNITLRNAVAQFQMEVVNAGTGFAGTTPTSFSPMGVTISKAPTANCATASTPPVYASGCFDSFTLITVDNSLPLLSPWGTDPTKPPPPPPLTTSADTTGTTMYLTNPDPTSATLANYTTWAALLTPGTELMFVQGGTDMPAGQALISLVTVASATPNPNYILLTTTGGTRKSIGCPGGNLGGSNAGGTPDPSDAKQDFLKIYNDAECARFTNSFNPGLDYVVKLGAGATYKVDGTNPTNPKLVRTTPTGTDVIAEQIIGFTVGAWSSKKCPGCAPGATPTPGYTTNPGDYGNDWASIRSLQIQIVARATPNSDNPSSFQNAYDLGSYQVQGISVVVNPRNLNTN